MSDEEREKWNRRYTEGDDVPRPDTAPFLGRWINRWAELGVAPGRALDVATGRGHNALALAEAGWQVTAADISAVALDRARRVSEDLGLSMHWVPTDLDEESEVIDGADGYDLITVFRYRNPALWPRLTRALAPDGWILVEHHLRTDCDVGGPSDPAFRLEPGELLEALSGLRIVSYVESVEEEASRPVVVARAVACAGYPGF